MVCTNLPDPSKEAVLGDLLELMRGRKKNTFEGRLPGSPSLAMCLWKCYVDDFSKYLHKVAGNNWMCYFVNGKCTILLLTQFTK